MAGCRIRPGDQATCRYDHIPGWFRGPRCRFDGAYVAYLGGCDGYGECLQDPLPTQLADGLGMACANFSQPGGGLDLIARHPALMGHLRNADAVVLQVTGAQTVSNRFFSVHPRRNDRFTAPSPALKALYPRIDFIEVHFVRHLLQVLARTDPVAFGLVVDEMRAAWMTRMAYILDRIAAPVMILWMADHAPGTDHGHPPRAPLFVDTGMLNQFRDRASVMTHVISPVALARDMLDTAGAANLPVRARHLLGPAAHDEAALHVLPVLKRMLTASETKTGPVPAGPVNIAV